MLYVISELDQIKDVFAQEAFISGLVEYIKTNNVPAGVKALDRFIYDMIKTETDIITKEDQFNYFNQCRSIAIPLLRNYVNNNEIVINGLHTTFEVIDVLIAAQSERTVTLKILIGDKNGTETGKENHQSDFEHKPIDEFIVQER